MLERQLHRSVSAHRETTDASTRAARPRALLWYFSSQNAIDLCSFAGDLRFWSNLREHPALPQLGRQVIRKPRDGAEVRYRHRRAAAADRFLGNKTRQRYVQTAVDVDRRRSAPHALDKRPRDLVVSAAVTRPAGRLRSPAPPLRQELRLEILQRP